MAYSFEATFTQPLLTKLDNGLIADASDWANAITKAYITTIKAGMPQGVPTTLPAPGLNPSAPPPFTIGTSPFTTADTRSKAMYTVIYAYFAAKELELNKGAIDSLTSTIKQVTLKIKSRAQSLKAVVELTKKTIEELSQIPTQIEEAVVDIKAAVDDQIDEIRSLNKTMQEEGQSLGLNQATIEQLFKKELDTINTLTNLQITNVDDVRKLNLYLAEVQQRQQNKAQVKSRETELKEFFEKKLVSVIKVIVELAKGLFDPTKILNIVSSLSSKNAKYTRLLNRVLKIDRLKKILQPRLDKLKKKKDKLLKEIHDYLQPKLIDIQKKLTEKIAEYAKRIKESKAAKMYKTASKKVKSIKNTIDKKIKTQKKNIESYKPLILGSQKLLGRAIALDDAIMREVELIKQEIESKTQSVSDIISSFDQKAELNALSKYLQSVNLQSFEKFLKPIVVDLRCTVRDLKTFIGARRKSIEQIAKEVVSVEQDARKLYADYVTLRTKQKQSVPETKSAAWIAKYITSFEDLLKYVVKKVKPLVMKVYMAIKKQIDRLKKFVKENLTKYQEDLRVFALNLIPLKSDVEDTKDKKAIAEAKLNKVKEKKRQAQEIADQARIVYDLGRGGSGLLGNLAKGNVKLSENQQYIDQLLDGYFNLESKQKTTTPELLLEKKKKIRSEFQGLLVIETLVYALTETVKDIASGGDFKADLEKIVTDIEKDTPGKRTLTAIKKLADGGPPKDFNSVKSMLNELTVEGLNDTIALTNLQQLERKYLSKSRATVKQIFMLSEKLKITNSQYINVLTGVKQYLEKHDSFLLEALKWLKSIVNKFFSWVKKFVKDLLEPLKTKIEEKRKRLEERAKREAKLIKERNVNTDAIVMTTVFGLAARAFWTGATWVGPTGTQHVALNIGRFTKMEAKTEDGASGMIREMAKGFEAQLNNMVGLIVPPIPTAIPPISFRGYK